MEPDPPQSLDPKSHPGRIRLKAFLGMPMEKTASQLSNSPFVPSDCSTFTSRINSQESSPSGSTSSSLSRVILFPAFDHPDRPVSEVPSAMAIPKEEGKPSPYLILLTVPAFNTQFCLWRPFPIPNMFYPGPEVPVGMVRNPPVWRLGQESIDLDSTLKEFLGSIRQETDNHIREKGWTETADAKLVRETNIGLTHKAAMYCLADGQEDIATNSLRAWLDFVINQLPPPSVGPEAACSSSFSTAGEPSSRPFFLHLYIDWRFDPEILRQRRLLHNIIKDDGFSGVYTNMETDEGGSSSMTNPEDDDEKMFDEDNPSAVNLNSPNAEDDLYSGLLPDSSIPTLVLSTPSESTDSLQSPVSAIDPDHTIVQAPTPPRRSQRLMRNQPPQPDPSPEDDDDDIDDDDILMT